jgi:rusticyanin
MSDSSTPENSNHLQLIPPSEPDSSRRSRASRVWLPVAVGAALAASAAAVAIAATHSDTTNPSPHPGLTAPPSSGQAPGGPPSSPWPYGNTGGSAGSGSPWRYGATHGGGDGGNSAPSNSNVPSAGTDLAKYLGQRLAGNGQQAMSLTRAEALGNQVPAGAHIDSTTRTIRFTTQQVSFVVLASPPSADMTFRTAGLNDPTIIVPPGAQITLEFVNGDSNEAHMWLLQTGDPGAPSVQPGWGQGAHVAAAPPLGNPTRAGQPAETITFTAPAPGTYHYDCPFPGHATQGMYGRFVVQST